MKHRQAAYPIAVVTACMTARGLPTFVLTTVVVTQEQAENGIHYYLVEAELLEGGYEEPFVHFDEHEAPAFLHPAVRRQLVSSPAATHSEETSCPASSK